MSERCKLLDGCLNVYVDVGTNLGLQIRKLWEPEYWPAAAIRNHFDLVFNRPRILNRSRDALLRHCHPSSPACWQNLTCVVGIEANPKHTSALANLAKHYQRQGRRTFILNTAATTFDGNITFLEPLDAFARSNFQWGASTVMRSRLTHFT